MTKQEQIESIKKDMQRIALIMNKFIVDSDEYVKAFDEWLDSTRDGVQYHGRWIKPSIAIKYAMPDVYSRDLENYANWEFNQDKLTSPSYEILVNDWIELWDELKELQNNNLEQVK